MERHFSWRHALRPVARHPVAAAFALVLVASAIFLAFPQIDPWFSELFYRSRGGFWLRKNAVLIFFRSTNDVLITTLVVVLLGSVAVKLARPNKQSPIAPDVVVYLLASLVLAPRPAVLSPSSSRPTSVRCGCALRSSASRPTNESSLSAVTVKPIPASNGSTWSSNSYPAKIRSGLDSQHVERVEAERCRSRAMRPPPITAAKSSGASFGMAEELVAELARVAGARGDQRQPLRATSRPMENRNHFSSLKRSLGGWSPDELRRGSSCVAGPWTPTLWRSSVDSFTHTRQA